MRVVINSCFGGFGLSETAQRMYCKIKGIEPGEWNAYGFFENLHVNDIERNDPILVSIIEQLGIVANVQYSKLKIVDIPDDVKWDIHEYDGMEWIAEIHRTWR